MITRLEGVLVALAVLAVIAAWVAFLALNGWMVPG